jgi:Chalcone isomerase-like
MNAFTRRNLLVLGMALAPLAWGQSAPTEVVGVKFDQQAQVGGKALVLNGAAVRYKAVFKVYAVGMYLPSKTNTAKAALEMVGPKRIHVVMLREVSGSELGRNFAHHFEDNVSRDEFAASIKQIFRFGEVFSTRKSMKAGESFTLDWVPGVGTTVSINGVPQGEPYAGQPFFNGMLKLWIGDKDSAGVRAALLGAPKAENPITP